MLRHLLLLLLVSTQIFGYSFGLSVPSYVRTESPFIFGGTEPSQLGTAFLLDSVLFADLVRMPLDSIVEFTNMRVDSRSFAVSLRRFSATEDRSDLKDLVLLRGVVYDDEVSLQSVTDSLGMMRASDYTFSPSTAFMALSPYGSNGFFRHFNTTFILSTPSKSHDGSTLETDQYTEELNLIVQSAVGVENKQYLASVLFDSVHLDTPIEMPLVDYVLPPDDGQKYPTNGTDDPHIKRTYRLAAHVDYQMFQKKGSNNDATVSYYNTLVGSTASIFGRDFGSDVVSSYVYVYTSPDPYPSTAGAALDYMTRTWNPSTPSRSMAALVSAKPLGGGIAYVATLCNTNYAYAVNGNMVGFFPVPLRSRDPNNWDIYVFAHEMGHVWGGQHTHELNPPADNCGNTPGCGPTIGTILSYCHLCQGGMTNIDLVFHQRSKDQIRAFINPRAC